MKRSVGWWIAVALSASACAGGNGAERSEFGSTGAIATPGFGNSQQIRIEASGRVFGENFEFTTTTTGYRGLLRGELTYMESSDGQRIVGSWGGSPIDLHVEFDGVTVRARGLFAGRMGKLRFDASELSGSFGRCSMELVRQRGLVFAGQRACLNDAQMLPAVVEVPLACVKMPPHRQVMLLSTLLAI